MWKSQINDSKELIYGIEIDSQALRMNLLFLGGGAFGGGIVGSLELMCTHCYF